MPLSVVILAAGQGKRMNSDLPKVLQPLAGKPLLQHVVDTARELNPAAIHVVYGHGGAQVQAALGHENLDWVLQAEQLGTGHAVLQAMHVIPDDHTVLVLYGDVPLVRAACLGELVHAVDLGCLALLTVNLVDASGYGRIVRDGGGRVTGIVEHKDASTEQLRIGEANSGLMAAPASRLRAWLSGLDRNNAQREYYLTDVVAGAVRSGAAITAIPVIHPVEVLGVNDRMQLAQVEAGYRRDRAEELMTAGATLADPLRIDVRGEVTVERDVFIDVNAVLVGTVHFGARVRVGPNCVIRDSTIGADTEIHANCVIEESVVGTRCRLGPFARVRPGTTLAQDVHLGNFVEVKNSRIGADSKINHLSYVGDSTVGAEVNVGAGSITCNYDGANKWPTAIEDGAFIGSGCMLVAPVRIGAAAAEDELTLTRARQVTVADWNRPVRLGDDEKAAAIAAAWAGRKR